MSTTNRKLLAAGLTLAPGTTSSPILDDEIAKAAAKDFDLTILAVDPAKSIDTVIGEWQKLLHQEEWTAVSIGFGIRGNPELTALFEKLVNAVIMAGPKKMAFAIKPDQIVDAFERVL